MSRVMVTFVISMRRVKSARRSAARSPTQASSSPLDFLQMDSLAAPSVQKLICSEPYLNSSGDPKVSTDMMQLHEELQHETDDCLCFKVETTRISLFLPVGCLV